jgi:hypothetical protein
MDKLLSFNFPQMSVEDKLLLNTIIRAKRAQILNEILGKAKSPELSERLGERLKGVHRFLGELIFLSKNNPDQFWRVLDHWSAPFLLSRLSLDPDNSLDSKHLDQLVSNLNALLLFERLLSKVPLEPAATYITYTDEHGCIHGLLHDFSLEFRNECFREKAVEWVCSPNEVAVHLAGKDEPEFVLPLPVKDNPFVRLIPLESSQAMGFQIVDETLIFGKRLPRLKGSNENASDTDWDALTLKDSLARAQEVITDLWPEVLDWADTLVPAFVDMGIPPKGIHYSSSFETGSPILMSRVSNPFTHAEDVVHEIQHHRLFLFGSETHFSSWTDQRQMYVSPYRADPRPLRGELVGLHAFLTVNELKRRRIVAGKQAADDLTYEMAGIHYKNLFAFRTVLEHEEFGDSGRDLFQQMARTIAEHHSLIKSAIKPETEKSFDAKICKHIEMVKKQSTEIKNDAALYRNWDETAQLAANFSCS